MCYHWVDPETIGANTILEKMNSWGPTLLGTVASAAYPHCDVTRNPLVISQMACRSRVRPSSDGNEEDHEPNTLNA